MTSWQTSQAERCHRSHCCTWRASEESQGRRRVRVKWMRRRRWRKRWTTQNAEEGTFDLDFGPLLGEILQVD